MRENISLKRTREDLKYCSAIAKATFCIITDGGTYKYNGTYVVVIAHEETMFGTNYGKLYSPEFYKSSYRSEIYALLVGIISFHQMIGRNNQEEIERIINTYCDNKSPINRINKRPNIRMTVNQHRDAQVDLELQVLHEIELFDKFNTTVRISYVKGHKQTTKNQLVSLMEDMHNHADNLCKKARMLPDQNKYYSFPENKVELILKVITAHVPKVTAKSIS
jgi:hypothetical protein